MVVLFVPLLVLVLLVWLNTFYLLVPVLLAQLTVISVLLLPTVNQDIVLMVSMLMLPTDVPLVLPTVSPVPLVLLAPVIVLLDLL